MKTLKVNLENCFGIGKFSYVFEYENVDTNTFLIYAPNGTMKTSFARTLHLVSKNDSTQLPCDRVYPERKTVCEIEVDGNPIANESILVVNAEDSNYDASDKISSFIARKELKEEYDKIYQDIEEKKNDFIKRLKTISQSSDCESELLETFRKDEKDTVLTVLEKIVPKLTDTTVNYTFKYHEVFDDKKVVKKFLETNKTLLDQYVDSYKEVMAKSTFFKGSGNTFGTYQANEILKSVEGDSFFHAGHKFTLDNGQEITSSKELKELVQAEITRIINDTKLKTAFEKIDKEITKNINLRAFQRVIENDNTLLAELKDYDEFKKKVWIDYLSQIKVESEQLIAFFNGEKPNLEKILVEARKEIELWKTIVQKFNSRFYVPFKVSLVNQEDIILKEKTAALEFIYDDQNGATKKQDKQTLLNILSKGEQRAYFILQFLFEIESRKQAGLDTLLVLDDIADSFDYKNKFAIIEYIKDLDLSGKFSIIILTHNFDFYRTVGSRLGVKRAAIFMTIKKSNREIALVPGQYMNSVFTHLLGRLSEKKIFISLLPFARNMIEYSEGMSCNEYKTLTCCLHLKTDTSSIDGNQLLALYNSKLPKTLGKTIVFGSQNIKDIIYEVAQDIIADPASDEIAIENKIALSMAIRLKAEEFMIAKLPDSFNIETIRKNQTKTLYDEVIKLGSMNNDILEILDRVILMTPENIHLNAFMYEPLIDMSLFHLKDLYTRVKTLP